jgi:hypothetical protein
MDLAPYSSILCPLICHLFASIKKQLAGKHFATDINVKQAVISWLKILQTNFFYAKIQALVPGWEKCLNVNGYYVKVSLCSYLLHTCHVYVEARIKVLAPKYLLS